MKRLTEWFISIAWDRVLLLSSAAIILIYVNWLLAIAVTLVTWALIRGINDVMRNVGIVLKIQETGIGLLTKEVLSVKNRVRTIEGGGDYVH